MSADQTHGQQQEQGDAKGYAITPDYLRRVQEALDRKETSQVRQLLKPLHVADISDVIDFISNEHREVLIDSIRQDFEPEILLELDTDVKEKIIGILGIKDSAEAITHLETDDAVDVIEDLDRDEQQEILEAIPASQRADLVEGLAYPEDSAGRLIEKKVVSVPEFWTVGQTIDFLRTSEALPRDFYQIFLVDPKLRPVGGVVLSRVMRSKRATRMNEIMQADLKLINADMDQEEVAFLFRQYGLVSTPVVNEQGRMVGVITVDDVVDVIEEEAQEDILRLGGISETDLHSGFGKTMRKRFPWLLINLITAVVASIVIALFEGAIEKLAALAVLMPIVASMGGNAGTQTLTVAVRAIAKKELTTANALRVIGKEIAVGILNGLVFSLIAGGLVFIWYGNMILSVIFASATIVTLLLAGLAGATIPLVLERAGVDPAIASGVFLTTITDVVAFATFLGLAVMVVL